VEKNSPGLSLEEKKLFFGPFRPNWEYKKGFRVFTFIVLIQSFFFHKLLSIFIIKM
jgi:hypothetical protein